VTLSLPEGWVIDPLAVARLEHQLTAAASFITGVVAPLAPLAPGASYRTIAEHLALRPLTAVQRHSALGPPPPGATLQRGGRARAAALLVDSGAGVHDPAAVDRQLLVASPLGRSPFPRRPLVVFLGVDPAEATSARAHDLTDALIGLDVEARLALPWFPEGPHLTRPCTPELRSLEVLRPDVLVVLDELAAERAEAWSGRHRATTIVTVDPAVPTPVEIRPWASTPTGRPHRARVHPEVPAPELAALVRRLVAGPQPGAPGPVTAVRLPRTQPAAGTGEGTVRSRPAAIRSVGILTGVLDAAGSERIDAMASRLERRGDRVHVSGEPDDDRWERVDVLVVRGLPADPDLLASIARRRSHGRPTVLDLGPDDLGPDDLRPDDPTGRPFGLSADARTLADACGLVSSPSESWCSELRAAGLQALHLPTPHRTRPPEVRVPTLPHPSPTITWVLDPSGARPTPITNAVEHALRVLVTDRPQLRVVPCGDPRSWPSSLALDGRTAPRPGGPDDELLSESTLILWTPDERTAAAAGTPIWLLRAAWQEVPALVGRSGAELPSELIASDSAIDRPDEPESWRDAIEWVLDDAASRRSIGADARRRAGATDADAHADRLVQSLLSWALGHRPTAINGVDAP
jgi:hypothetical protein